MMTRFSKFVALVALASVVTACSDDKDLNTTTTGNTGTGAGTQAGTQNPNAGSQTNAPDSLAYFQQNIGDKVYFGYDEYTLSSESQSRLSAQANWIKQYAAGKEISIEGHCDERGTREYNIALGARRAASVRNFLVSQGISASQIKAISFGKERPIIEGSDEQSWAQNRRGVTVIK